MSFVHAAVSMNPSAGVVAQMEDEARAARMLHLDWMVLLSRGTEAGRLARRWPAALRYAVLRTRFYARLIGLSRQGHVVILRHSPGDPFLFVASYFLGPFFTVHHTLEEPELAASADTTSRIRLQLERVLGRRVIARARGIVCMTPEIARQLRTTNPTASRKPALIYPNGILYPEGASAPADRRGERPEILFVASYFFGWHGLEALLDSMKDSDAEGTLHLVGVLPESLLNKAKADGRVTVHGHLDRPRLEELIARSWAGLSSFALIQKGMTEACTLKVRDYLRAGLPVYAGHRDSALADGFPYFREGPADWSAIVNYASVMRSVSRMEVTNAARPAIDKRILLEQLHRSLQGIVEQNTTLATAEDSVDRTA